MKKNSLIKPYFALGLAMAIATPIVAQESQTPNSGSDRTDQSVQSDSGKSGMKSGAQTEGPVSSKERKFITKTAKSNMMEIHMAQMAQQKASSQQVKDIAKRLETDHTQATEQLKPIAESKGVSLPDSSGMMNHMGSGHSANTTDNPSSNTSAGTSGTDQTAGTTTSAGTSTGSSASADMMSSGSGKHMSKLNGLSGAEFDREYLRNQLQHHQKDIKEFEKAANDSKMSSETRNFAQQILPNLREHLRMIQSAQSQMSAKTDRVPTNSSSDTTVPGTPGTTDRQQ